jgi:OOP family OmpA-OmpF porin
MKRFRKGIGATGIGALLLAATATAATGASAAQAEAPIKDQIYLVPGVTIMNEDRENDIDGYVSPGIGIGGQFTDRWGFELHYAGGDTQTENTGIDVDVESYRLDGLYYLGGEYWKPYVVGGIGRHDYDVDGGGSQDSTQLNLGVGAMRAITDRLAIRGDARVWHLTDSSSTNPGLSVGLRYVFAGPTGPEDSDGDGVSDPTDQCPGTPRGTAVDMNGCPLDSDRDGVPNADDACPGTPAGTPVDRRGCPRDSDRDGVIDADDACPGTPRGDEVDARGCTVEEEQEMTVERIELRLEFDFDSAKLRPGHYAEIERVAGFMREYPETRAQLEGHTDSRGTEAYNQALSERRAYSVRDYLIDEADIDPRRITAVGYGEARPVADNDTDEGRQRNRRVEAVIDTGEMSVRPRRED